MKNGCRFWLEVMRAATLAAALWVAPAYAFTTGGDWPWYVDFEPASGITAAGVDERSQVHGCIIREAAGHSHCCQPPQGAQRAGPARLRDDGKLALLFHRFAIVMQKMPADLSIAPAQSPALSFSRFILFGNFRS